jgi:dipeptidyl aminopeptidase/acylaminoacyl peptidase
MSRAREVSKIVATVDSVENSIDNIGNIDLSSTINTASAAAVAYLLDGAPAALDTLNELAAALNDNESFATTVTNELSSKLSISSASATYLPQTTASATYLTNFSASSSYLLQSSASNVYVRRNGANYAVSNGPAVTVSTTTPTTIASITITTTGRPVLLVGTGDANPNTAGDWNWITLYRDSTRVGKIIINQTSGGSYNNPFGISHIDVPAAGTYTYKIKAYQGVGTITYGETGADQAPTLLGIELF